MQKINKLKVTMVLLLTWVTGLHAETFCVANGEEFKSALSIANSNGQADHIKLKLGDYYLPSSGFSYNAPNENYDLEISGKWIASNNDECGSRLLTADRFNRSQIRPGPDSTPSSVGSLLSIFPAINANVSVSFLNIVNGESFDCCRGIGLYIDTPTGYTGKVLVENNIIQDHDSPRGAGIDIDGSSLGEGAIVMIRNNLIRDIDSDNPVQIRMTRGIGQENIGLYFINNTVYDNGADLNSVDPAGVKIIISDSVNAFIANNIMWKYEINNGGFRDFNLISIGTAYSYLFNNNMGVVSGDDADEMSGNFSVEPIFGGDQWNFQPVTNSPEINAGIMPPTNPSNPPQFDENWDLGALDLYGHARVNQGTVDVGAVESDLIFINGFD